MFKKKYSLYHLPLFSFFSRKLYRDVGYKWKGVNMGYLFLLLAICCATPILNLRHFVTKSIGSDYHAVIAQIPDITIIDGKVTLKQSRPLIIRRNDGSPVAVIDTTGATNFIYHEHILALLTRDKLTIRLGRNQFNTISLAGISEFHVDKQVLTGWLVRGQNAFAPLTYGIFLLLSYAVALLGILAAAVAGLIIALGMHISLRFAAVMRIAAVAATPAIILLTISNSLGYTIPDPVYLAGTLLYMLIGIRSCSKPEPEELEPRVDLTLVLHPETVAAEAESHAA